MTWLVCAILLLPQMRTLGAQERPAEEPATVTPAEQLTTAEQVTPAEQTGGLSGNAFDAAELPVSSDEPVVEWTPAPAAEPLVEVKPTTSESLVREAAPPMPNVEGKYLAADLVDASMLSGPGYTLLPEVEVRGYMLHYTLQTRFGEILAESKDLLPIRIEEVSAIERLDETGMAKAAGKQARSRTREVWEGLKRIVRKPKETVQGLPDGVARMVKARAQKIGRQASKLYDRSRDRLAEDENAAEPSGPLTAAREPKPAPDPNESATERKVKKEGKRLIKSELGYASARRFIAREVSVDPYSSNPILKEKLDALAWSATSSNVGFNLVMKSLGAATFGVLPQMLKIDRIVWEETPENISEMNRKRLNELGCTPGLTRRFVRNGAFSSTLQTDLVNALSSLRLIRGCDDVLAMSIDARGEIEGRFMVNSLRLLLAAPLPGQVGYTAGECAIETLGGGLGALCEGELVVPVPVDALIWDADMAIFLNAENVRDARARTILLTGFADQEARVRLTERGFAIIEYAPLN